MKRFLVISFLLFSISGFAQSAAKTAVFKVRSKVSECKITCKGPAFLLEINNPVTIKVKGRNQKITVVAVGGKVMSIEGNVYYVRFTRPGPGVISVYQDTDKGRVLIGTKMLNVKSPPIYFCGIKMDSISKSIRMRGTNFYAYSNYYKKELPISSFEMYYVDDTTIKKLEPVKMVSDTCMLSPDMKKRILSFQPKFNYIYFHNIVMGVPDGSKRLLDPIELNIVLDTADREHLSLMYAVRKKRL
ncbi:MAG: hypothetical protein ACJ77K_19360 [Bacteroidia bacterium]